MFSSLKLNSLKCQSNSESDKKKDKCDDNDDDDEDDDDEYVSDHMYEKLPKYDNRTCKCHSNYISRSPKTFKTSCSDRISKWRMECPGVTNLRILRPEDDVESKNNQGEKRDIFGPKTRGTLKTKVTTVSVRREDGNLGITLRGGFQQNADLSKPVTITYVKPDGPAAREGIIKCGDRLLAVDGIPLQGRSLCEAQTLLRQPTPSTLLTIEYDVNVLDSVEHANGPLLVEMELNSFHELGISLGRSESGVIIEGTRPGSLADRSGALHVGDEILAVNSTRLQCTELSVEEITKFIACSCPKLRLEILPSTVAFNYSDVIGTWRSKDHLLSHGSSPSGLNTLKSHVSRRIHDAKASDHVSDAESKSFAPGPAALHGSNMALTHSESVHTTVFRENGSFGLECVDSPDGAVIIGSVTNGSPAERSQCLYPGDRILSINNANVAAENLKAKDVNDLLHGKSEGASHLKINLHTEFDVLDSVIPASGVFTVKLAKQGTSGLGITITASKTSGFVVCEMRKGSIAYRAGSLIPGDKILAINNIPLSQCSVDYVARILHQSSKIVALRVQRKDNGSSDVKSIRKVTYTVELQRYGGPLGITIAGSEEPFHPITISGLSSGGLAEQTGVLHIGDEILAINNHNLYGEPLSKAHVLLQNSPDLVTLKISRAIAPYFRFSNNISPILPPSVDSAVESWDSSRLDLASPEYHQKNSRDVRGKFEGKKKNKTRGRLNGHRGHLTANSTTNHRDCGKRNVKMKTFEGQYSQELENIRGKTPSEGGDIPDLSLLDEITSENLKIQKELDLLSLKLDAECKIDLKEANENGHGEGVIPSKLSGHHGAAETADSGSHDGLEDPNGGDPGKDSKCDVDVDYVRADATPSRVLDDSQLNGYDERNRESFVTNDFENMEMTYLSDSKNWFKSYYLGSECGPESIRNEFQNSQLHKVTLYKDPIYEDFGFSVSDGLYERGVFINRIRKGGPADLNNVLKPYDRILQVNETFTQDFDCCLTVPLIASAGDSITLLVARNSGGYLSDSVLEGENPDQGCNNFTILASAEGDTEGSQRILV